MAEKYRVEEMHIFQNQVDRRIDERVCVSLIEEEIKRKMNPTYDIFCSKISILNKDTVILRTVILIPIFIFCSAFVITTMFCLLHSMIFFQVCIICRKRNDSLSNSANYQRKKY